ncbi:diguanylate cyclase (GGDEF) domain-containing protein [Geodermatophilus telluris]|uniref:Diguanylate cyclase (GGDEF) domain-containing protein n=1 Tax=Geodermatophilus telluris TaxID=1190417 RepID=A0A1G6UFD5_9ACTN|nr:bifunctional diguanylate cyclase/phosphodiesterase [Geodermatophilus telluris]SDD39954.1 diguanylate cyclase (GGDEF) domain-containing protein [Geodermatophilus telluris]
MTTTANGAPTAGSRVLRLGPAQRILLLTAALALAATVLFAVVVRSLPSPTTVLPLPWVVWAVAFALTETLVVHVQWQREAHTFSMGDLVLAAGLFLAPPTDLVLAQLAGATVAFVLHRRQRGVKLAFNVALYALGGALGTAVFAALGGPANGPWAWAAALAAVLVTTVHADLAIFAAISLSEGRADPQPLLGMLGLSLPFTVGSAAVGVIIARTGVQDPASLALFALPTVLILAAYRAYTGTRQQQEQLRLLHEVTSLLHQSSDLDAALTDFLDSVRGAFRAGSAELVLLGHGGDDEATVTRTEHDADPVVMAPLEDVTPVRELLAAGLPSGVTPARNGRPGAAALDAYARGRGIGEAMVSVLRTEDRVHGLLLVAGHVGDVGTFGRHDLAVLETFARHVATSLERGRLEQSLHHVTELKERLRRQALHDGLTGLPNRTLFLDRARHAIAVAGRTGTWPAVLYLDLDGFKPVNDTHGHEAGDQLLRIVAARLTRCLRADDTVARLGGDEFAVLVEGPVAEDYLREVVDRIEAAVGEPVDLGDGRLVSIGVSVGVALGGAGTADADALVRAADDAMYRVKRDQEPRGASERVPAAADPADELARAVRDGEMRVVYQPLVDLRSGRPTGAEALVRWEHPVDGLRTPDRFLGLAERTGLVVEIGALVLREACTQAARWTAARPDATGLTVTVNVSARQLSAPGFTDDVRAVLADTGLAARHLVLEVTETALMEDQETAAATLRRLRALGVRIAVDDFGTGYSSLAYLSRFPVDLLKVAREFVSRAGEDGDDDAITRAIVDLAGTLGLLTVAEGVETARQYEFVTALGCDLAQGHLFARPVPAEVVHAILTGVEGTPRPAGAAPSPAVPGTLMAVSP